MPRDPMSAKDFAAKVEWEGGILEALDYGLKHTDLDPQDEEAAELRAAWKELEEKFEPVKPIVNRLERLLENLEIAEGDED